MNPNLNEFTTSRVNMAGWEQYGIVLVAVLIGGGFAFGGIASYAGLTGGNSNNNQDQFNASIPSQQYSERRSHAWRRR